MPISGMRSFSSAMPRLLRAAFMEVYDSLRSEVLDKILPTYGLPKEVAEYQAKMMDYNVPGGKLNRGLSVVHA